MTHRPTVAVVIGRFQVPALHTGHRHLIDTASQGNDELLIILGSAEFPTPRNPLSFEMRRTLIHEHYPHAAVLEIQDFCSDEDWSRALDVLIHEHYCQHAVTLYGSRDSFLSYYSGCYKTVEVKEVRGICGTTFRTQAGQCVHTEAFRRGVIHGYTSRLAVTRPMVDIAVIDGPLVLLGRKNSDPSDRWRFPGGLVDQTDRSLEEAATREIGEEAPGIEIDELTYLGSKQVIDWRYRGTGEAGLTALFRAKYLAGALRAGDDLDDVAWKPLVELRDCLVEEHQALGEMLLKSVNL